MKNRFSTIDAHTLRALCMIVLCCLTWACKDEYLLDDEKPPELSENIYSILEQGEFSNYRRLLSDPDINAEGARDLKEVLSKTGSKTVFVANDYAWNNFFQRNAQRSASDPWHNATSYENLTPSQKKLLVHTSMLNNAIVMENLSASEASGENAPEPGQYMRRYTDVDVSDSVTFVPADQLPYTYSENEDEDYWKKYRDKGQGIYLVIDDTRNMMLHFTREHMGRSDIQITDEDFEKIMGESRTADDVHIYDARLIEKDLIAENGYVNITEKVLCPLPNMAEVIRTNGKTNIFSHILERFSAPWPNTELTEAYKTLHPSFSSTIYTKRYFAQDTAEGELSTDPDGKRIGSDCMLQYDPGWNEYKQTGRDARCDMGAMFVPNDEAMIRYFSKGGAGSTLIETYSKDHQEKNFDIANLEELYQNIDLIDLSTVAKLVNVIMFRSFVLAVPSKMYTLRDYGSMDTMFGEEDVNKIDECLLANNGVVYVMDEVYPPAEYGSVAGPANITQTNLVMNWAINNGKSASDDWMHMNYYAYLLAMKSTFSFFLPSDEALTRYYDPMSFTSMKPQVASFKMADKADKEGFPLIYPYFIHKYDKENGTINEEVDLVEEMGRPQIVNRLRDILESHTIVHTDDNPIDNEDEYYIAKNGAALKVTKEPDPDNPGKYRITKVQGGFQLENERMGMTGGDRGTVEINIEPHNRKNMRNGHTFIINDSPVIPASHSIYYIMHEDPAFQYECTAFYDLTDNISNKDVILACNNLSLKNGQVPNSYTTWNADGAPDYNVNFFSNYNYTVLVPTNDAINEAHSKGLPDWDDIRADYYASIELEEPEEPIDPEEEVEPEPKLDGGGRVIWKSEEDRLRVLTKVTYLNNFVRCHFLDNSFFEDKTAREEKEFTTFSYDKDDGVFVKVHMGRNPSQLYVRDNFEGPIHHTTGNLRNIMARDMVCIHDEDGTMSGATKSPKNAASMLNISLRSSSGAVIHQIDGVLNHKELTPKGRYDGDWADVKACRNYLRRFSLPSTTSIKITKHHE